MEKGKGFQAQKYFSKFTFCGLNVVSKEKMPFICEMETVFKTKIYKIFL